MGSSTSTVDDFSENAVKRFLAKAREDFDRRWKKVYTASELKWSDYECLRTLGTGAFGRVIMIRQKESRKCMALKIIRKEKILELEFVHRIFSEKQLLHSVKIQYVPHIFFHSQDGSNIYFALEFLVGGDFFTYLRRVGRFNEESSRFYAAQACMALEYLHAMDIAYRDLKPENTLIDRRGYIKLTDFGCAERVKGRTWSFCGTPEYMAPEVVISWPHGKAADWWSFGIFIYEMVAGRTPFQAAQELETLQKVIVGIIRYPARFSEDLKDLLVNLLERDTSKRYGNLRAGVFDITNHRWFESTNFSAIYNRTVEAPFVPSITDWDEEAEEIDELTPASSDEIFMQAFESF